MSATDLFWEVLPQFIVMGMTPDDFWYRDPKLARAYLDAYDIKLEIENRSAWLNGLYNTNAFGVVIGNAFGSGHSKKLEYPEKPIEFTKKPKNVTQEDIERERLKAINYFTSLKESWDARQT